MKALDKEHTETDIYRILFSGETDVGGIDLSENPWTHWKVDFISWSCGMKPVLQRISGCARKRIPCAGSF